VYQRYRKKRSRRTPLNKQKFPGALPDPIVGADVPDARQLVTAQADIADESDLTIDSLDLDVRSRNSLLRHTDWLDPEGGLGFYESYQRLLQLPTPHRIKNFGAISFRRTIEALIRAGVQREVILASTFWKTASGSYQRVGIHAFGVEENRPAGEQGSADREDQQRSE
jgi:hypothetical protein